MKLISLTQGQFAKVDDEDFEWLNQWKWCAAYKKSTNSYYAIRTDVFNNRKNIFDANGGRMVLSN